MKNIVNGKFIRICFIDHIDDFRYNSSYLKLMKECKLDGRIKEIKELIKYVKRKRKARTFELKQPLYFII
jgi:hypothetical protein